MGVGVRGKKADGGGCEGDFDFVQSRSVWECFDNSLKGNSFTDCRFKLKNFY